MRTSYTRWLSGLCLVGWWVLTRDTHPISLCGTAALVWAAITFAAPVLAERAPWAGLRRRPRLYAFPLYAVVLLFHSFLGALAVVWGTLTRRYRPGVVRIRTRLNSHLGRTFLANSLNLVPGTLVLWTRDRHLFVHWFKVVSYHSVEAAHRIARPLERSLEGIFG